MTGDIVRTVRARPRAFAGVKASEPMTGDLTGSSRAART
jgi:hypothetical protein